jgi:ketosteroid isomerase-like protein
VSPQCLAVFALFLTLCCSAQEPAKVTTAEQEIRALETIRLKSPTKIEVWSGNVAKDALFQLGNGSVASKQDLLTHMQHQVMEDSLEMSDTMFSQIGDAAIFSYVFRRNQHGDGVPDTHQHIRRTLVYQRTGSSWQMIASAVAVIPYADLESKPVDRKILDTYLGVWTAAHGSSTVTLTVDGGKLMAQASDDPEKYEFQALSDNTFVIQGDPQLITFEEGPDGKATRLLFRDVGGSVDVYRRFH